MSVLEREDGENGRLGMTMFQGSKQRFKVRTIVIVKYSLWKLKPGHRL